MKKLTILILCLALTLCCAACATGKNENGNPSENEEGEGNMQTPNPFIEYGSIEEAEQAAGFEITAPDDVEGKNISLIEVMDGKMIQVRYGDELEVCIRKQAGNEDISGDYNEYTSVEEIDGVSFKGDGELVYTAVWVKDGYSYAVLVDEGLSSDDFAALVETVA